MATVRDFHRIAESLEGTTTARHFDRTAFKVARIYATLPVDEKSANLLFSPLDQDRYCTDEPEGFAPVPGGWGRMGYTTVTFAKVKVAVLRRAMEAAWARAQPKTRKR